MNDFNTPIQTLKDRHEKFVQERGWTEFNNPKNLAMSISIEAAEILEIFQWLTLEESEDLKNGHKKFEHLQEEMADVLIYMMAMANRLNIDLTTAVINKMKKNEKRTW